MLMPSTTVGSGTPGWPPAGAAFGTVHMTTAATLPSADSESRCMQGACSIPRTVLYVLMPTGPESASRNTFGRRPFDALAERDENRGGRSRRRAICSGAIRRMHRHHLDYRPPSASRDGGDAPHDNATAALLSGTADSQAVRTHRRPDTAAGRRESVELDAAAASASSRAARRPPARARAADA